jgi:hypothetical protein
MGTKTPAIFRSSCGALVGEVASMEVHTRF